MDEEVKTRLGEMVRRKRIEEDLKNMDIQAKRGSIPIKRVMDPEIEKLVVDGKLLLNEHLVGTDMSDQEFLNLYGARSFESLENYARGRGWEIYKEE